MDLGYSKGSVIDLSGSGAQLGAQLSQGGASIDFDDNSNVTGVSVHYGYGYDVSASGTITEALNVRGEKDGK